MTFGKENRLASALVSAPTSGSEKVSKVSRRELNIAVARGARTELLEMFARHLGEGQSRAMISKLRGR